MFKEVRNKKTGRPYILNMDNPEHVQLWERWERETDENGEKIYQELVIL